MGSVPVTETVTETVTVPVTGSVPASVAESVTVAGAVTDSLTVTVSVSVFPPVILPVPRALPRCGCCGVPAAGKAMALVARFSGPYRPLADQVAPGGRVESSRRPGVFPS